MFCNVYDSHKSYVSNSLGGGNFRPAFNSAVSATAEVMPLKFAVVDCESVNAICVMTLVGYGSNLTFPGYGWMKSTNYISLKAKNLLAA
jgi:hypothetical protein